MKRVINLEADSSGFAEDKDRARSIRQSSILPTLDKGEIIVLDFGDIKFATQSFVHALIGESLQKHGESALSLIEFKNCSSQMRGLIELVVGYSLGGFALEKSLDETGLEARSNLQRRAV
jgi:hypothetical protein